MYDYACFVQIHLLSDAEWENCLFWFSQQTQMKLNSLWNEHDAKLQYLPYPHVPTEKNPDCEHAHKKTLRGTTFNKFNMNNDLALFYT